MAPTPPPHHCHGDTPLLTHFKETPTWSNCRKKFLPTEKSAYSSFKIVSYVDKPMQFSSVKTCKHKPGGASTQPPPNCVCCCTMTQLLSFWASQLSHKADLKPSRVSRGGQSQGYSWDLQIWSLVDLILLTVPIKCEMSSHVRSSCIPHCLEIP